MAPTSSLESPRAEGQSALSPRRVEHAEGASGEGPHSLFVNDRLVIESRRHGADQGVSRTGQVPRHGRRIQAFPDRQGDAAAGCSPRRRPRIGKRSTVLPPKDKPAATPALRRVWRRGGPASMQGARAMPVQLGANRRRSCAALAAAVHQQNVLDELVQRAARQGRARSICCTPPC